MSSLIFECVVAGVQASTRKQDPGHVHEHMMGIALRKDSSHLQNHPTQPASFFLPSDPWSHMHILQILQSEPSAPEMDNSNQFERQRGMVAKITGLKLGAVGSSPDFTTNQTAEFYQVSPSLGFQKFPMCKVKNLDKSVDPKSGQSLRSPESFKKKNGYLEFTSSLSFVPPNWDLQNGTPAM